MLGKDLILGERKKRECIKFKKNSQQSKKSLYSGTGSTVRVCPNFPEERVTISFVGIHCFIPVRERLLQGNGSKQSQRPPKRMARSDNRITWMRRNLLSDNRKHLDNDRVPSVKVECCRSVAVCANKVITSHEKRKPLCMRAPAVESSKRFSCDKLIAKQKTCVAI